ncbi:ABC transporter permease [Iocasia frigidifontis]|uniref:ABC transporter permease n=1 Tax=Iocasia fonsfrigidae TaxID=2682810 RepID=A0A8A7KHI6_9FIRM|nr:ABC transporter permease [Iocasia fonsfrigidae]QTL97342.1 ABC transporter permease [Iocasia fonsfrigidae]
MFELLKKFKESQIFSPLLALLILLLFDFIFIDGFLSIEIRDGRLFGTLIDILNRAAPLALLAIGMTLVIATGGIDLSVGAVIAISGAIAAKLIGGQLVIENGTIQYVTQVSLPIALFASMGMAAICGMWNGFLVGKIKVQPIVATLILMVAGRGIAQLITKAQIITIYYKPFHYIGTGYLLGLPFTIFIVVLAFLLVSLFVRKTAVGLYIESIGINDIASKYVGIKPSRIKFIVYTICGLMAGIAGLIVTSNVKAADANNAGLWKELDAILSVVIGGNSLSGGKFTIAGSIIGALVVQTLTTTVYAAGIAPEVTLVVKAVVVVIITIIQSQVFRDGISKLIVKRRDLT